MTPTLPVCSPKFDMKEAVSIGVLVAVARGQLVPNRLFFQKAKRVTDANAIICSRKQAWAIKSEPIPTDRSVLVPLAASPFSADDLGEPPSF